ncbi:MAG: type III PLP-dependent enzyme [Nitrospirae bacterium CG_4_10_14_0_8_um_filter_41_23]|nr:type III PLP-dependent enzyme [Nitrospirota bacterium]OIP59279.1 MAG: ornithine decarboxylase [Nitrospirae bacterium CG2_30_41_42]PIQ94308.1 MAG: ornithine decarboxylase [Nitrospirae bacterium CG11_big_fil_rev_8_21_14_0_20_41_14]PIV44187.1 MAG: type III PLP-dependent enzyme [Nitrospirae bacterium CG02_land_8_20_14_3_00_41_53]PIW87314.1 MAG: type III PLP-dependent enzyme [Nitrospirae bacterium CG_4_8_14_3_um_filter_41_47]PIY86793.1 MAG: type III PLP-dependent enzyme [Nitrospirae bacterium CG
MLRTFKVEKFHAGIIPESTLFKVLRYLDNENIETPFLLIDSEKVKEKASLIGRYIKNSKVFYAVKANPDIKILKFLNRFKLGFEIASEGELKILLSLGVKPERIISSNPIKSLKFLKMSASYGVNYFSFDSADEVDKLSRYVPGCNVYVRLSVPNEGSEWPLSKKFGVELDEALTLLRYAKEKGINPVGITFHVGSQCTNVYNWNIALDKAKALWDMAEKNGIKLTLLNIGGGYPIRYTKNVVSIETIEKNVNKLIYERFPKGLEIYIEPGRAVIGDAGILVTTVIGKARRANEDWLYIDVGVFNGLMESVGGIKYSYIVESCKHTRYKKRWTIAGPSCDSFDVIDNNVSLPEPNVGDLILILSSGAYTVSYASEFNGFSIPKTILMNL